ncbi:gamma-glutamylcyclotransferase family protein [Streptomyces sp. NBC_01012]|uniref:gamma-glutamylcyclotransferase family protein n=1 Tax=Streptomyces sp. NBC_01012 TaxID=2903717 RepID=UPI0038649ADE|nr:gamma-glutamylcyclotransferase [Streptomyces sp. NBC_01012]
MTEAGLPFFVYGTLLPGEPNHDRFLRGRTQEERPALLPDALLYEGPGYPYAIEGHGTVRGALVTATPGAYAELLAMLDGLEQYLGPGHPRNLYERVARRAVPMTPDAPAGPEADLSGRPGTGPLGGPRSGPPNGPGTAPSVRRGSVRAWVYLAAAPVARSLRAGGTPVPNGDWLSPPRRPRPPRPMP